MYTNSRKSILLYLYNWLVILFAVSFHMSFLCSSKMFICKAQFKKINERVDSFFYNAAVGNNKREETHPSKNYRYLAPIKSIKQVHPRSPAIPRELPLPTKFQPTPHKKEISPMDVPHQKLPRDNHKNILAHLFFNENFLR